MFTHILCPIDGSEASQEALDVAAKLAANQAARLTLCSVVDVVKAASMAFGQPSASAACLSALAEEAKTALAEGSERTASIALAKTVRLDGSPADTLVKFATLNGCDLIVIGSHGRGGLPRAFLGSVAEDVMRRAGIPVMIVRWNSKAAKTETGAALQPAVQ